MVAIPSAALAAIAAAAERAWPREACGLLVGRAGADAIAVHRAIESANLAAAPARAFEIDSQLWLDLTIALEDSADDIVGLFHSHPDGAADPSARDLADAWGDRLAWLITAIAGGRAGATRAYVFRESDGARRFESSALHVADPARP